MKSNLLFALAMIFCAIDIAFLAQLGMAYMDEGHGLHPYIVTVGTVFLSAFGTYFAFQIKD